MHYLSLAFRDFTSIELSFFLMTMNNSLKLTKELIFQEVNL